jgi:hypothetical protein
MTTDGLGWLTDRQRDGGIDRIPLPANVSGELWVCGKRAAASRMTQPEWDAIVCLVEPHEIAGHHPDYLAWLRSDGGRAVWFPVPDLHAPTLDIMQNLVGEVVARLRSGERVLLHCAAGYGRSGTTAVCALIELGSGADEALATVASARPGAGPEVGAQRELVSAFTAARAR